ncbi:MAG: DNA polymerase I [Omnitrophica WOR_2 bacterium GWF2_38_59]|nr:MAG: DNA polymerase I [Omnitrophica WOR_2 bacterium GWF2_38_59]OGX47739.1 MAG: DNA polymerase I [Omnitrophica WOR_2 bacterium RIFOXYA2_FULL_38_17]OGX50429.1 MAG: DNA polymerase I [Omnitrophica WOR_2 bacterium RIFOXYA12_FULL_38_10]OGX55778.1 MAG: DNA polymerase I [Omnitrophica WOR_2 bacterium RIFOXYB2_FULL_38_16]OGX57729.1 MAG: DNA polymerase I [Omnitrophica WOR_2 bacterium RIFOXYC2_FULL_38_12]HBG60380.1 DNA polymerase I [Candidatus Omnitrophota bacterium]
MNKTDKSRLFLIDGHGLCYRAFFAIRELATSKGQATNAVYGFCNILRKILREHKPDYLAVCFDSKKKTYREEKYAEYKVQRPSMPDNMVSQIPIIKDVIKAHNLMIFELGGYEADDIIATFSNKASDEGLEVIIVSDDKDMYQLLGENVKIFNSRKDVVLSYEDVKKDLGFEPSRIVDYIGLAGDKSDNLPGVMGVGEVTAKKLLSEFDDLENIYEHIEEVTPIKLREKLQENKESAFFSKELAILETTVPFHFDLDQLKVEKADNKLLYEIYKDLEFRKWADELSSEVKMVEDINIRSLRNKSDINEIVEDIKEQGKVSFLSSTVDELFESNSIYFSVGRAKVFRLKLDMIDGMKDIFSDANITKITFDIKGASKALASQGCELNGCFDVMLAGYLLNPSRTSYSISDLSWEYLKVSVSEQDKISHETENIYHLFPMLSRELEQKSLLSLFNDIEIPLALVLSKMERCGVKIDVELLKGLSISCDKKIEDLKKILFDIAGEEFNINSPKQLSVILFEKMKYPAVKKTKTGYSTDESVLTKLAKDHEFPKLILEHRQLAKLKSTYIDALPVLVDSNSGRIHASFVQNGTETGRLSSRNPNLQNIPIRTELGAQIRKAIIPSSDDRILLAADYSQIELRILAHLSGDETLKKAFDDGQDVHQYTASLIFDVEESKVTKDMRNSAKRVNFGIVYGMSSFGLSKDLEVSQKEAQMFIDKYFARYPKVKVFMDDTIKECEEQGFVRTLLNRRRYIPEIRSKNMSVRQFAQRQAINTPVQGSAADLMKLAMINIQNDLEKRKLESEMIITVHDELVFDVVKKEQDEVAGLVRSLMETPLRLSVPVTVTVKIGSNWLEMREIA